MSEMTLQDLLTANVGLWHAAADQWHQLARRVDDVAEQLIRGTRDLSYAWPSGTGSSAAGEKAASLRAEVSNTYNPAKRIHDALDQHAYGMAALRQQAEEIVESAKRAGYTVDTAAMTMKARLTPPTGNRATSPERTSRTSSPASCDKER